MKLPKAFSRPYWGWMLILAMAGPLFFSIAVEPFMNNKVHYSYYEGWYKYTLKEYVQDYFFENLLYVWATLLIFNIGLYAIKLIRSEKKDDNPDKNPL